MKITLIGLIYKSINYLNWMLYGINKYGLTSTKHDVDYLIVANDATPEILSELKTRNIKHVIYQNEDPKEYYINRVYKAYNFGASQANTDVIVFINSDFAYSPNWLDNLVKHLNSYTIPVSRLVESGKKTSGQHAISLNFGKCPSEFREEEFLTYVKTISEDKAEPGGLFMPVAFFKENFIAAGGYPPGNVVQKLKEQKKQIKITIPGDRYLFYHNFFMSGRKHITIFNSVVYHIIEGEKDE